ncbi:hypothetical protein V2J09_019829 [Rumex salicifolius]
MDGTMRLPGINSNTCKKFSNEEDSEVIIRRFEEATEKAGAIQTETLRHILDLNWGVEYLKRWIGNDINREEMDSTTLESLYTSLVPLSSHADVEPYIQRIADGETSPLLTQQPITHLSLSSGTTDGRQKYVPFTRHSAQTTLQTFRIAAAYRSRVYPLKGGGKILEFIYSSKQFKTKGGLIAGTATTHYFASKEFKIKQEKTKTFTCSPEEVISCGDYKQTTYCHLLLGLIYSKQVEFVTSTFAYSILQALIAFEELWREICIDITQGSLSDKITIPSVRESVLKLLSPNPCLGEEVKEKCEALEELDWLGMIKKLWPNAKYLYSIMTGSMELYTRKLKHYAGDLPLVSADYGSTESWIGVNVDPSLPPERVSFSVVPTFSYFEFIPLHRRRAEATANAESHGNFNGTSSSDPTEDFIEEDPVPLSKVKVGQEYEVVLTTFTGLYRYRLGDIVEVSGFHKGTPKLNFLCRRKLILTVNIDKNTEKDLQVVVEKGSQLLKARSSTSAEVVDFTSHADVARHPGHYVIYWEVKGDVEGDVMEECCREMDKAFMDHGYVVSRKTNSIGPLELCIVGNGTFKKVLDLYVSNGAALSQFKTPRCTSNLELLKILNCSTVKRVYSTAYGVD